MSEDRMEFFIDSDEDMIGQGGFFVRNDLFKAFRKLRADGEEPIGIRVDDSWNLEIICKLETTDGD